MLANSLAVVGQTGINGSLLSGIVVLLLLAVLFVAMQPLLEWI